MKQYSKNKHAKSYFMQHKQSSNSRKTKSLSLSIIAYWFQMSSRNSLSPRAALIRIIAY